MEEYIEELNQNHNGDPWSINGEELFYSNSWNFCNISVEEESVWDLRTGWIKSRYEKYTQENIIFEIEMKSISKSNGLIRGFEITPFLFALFALPIIHKIKK